MLVNVFIQNPIKIWEKKSAQILGHAVFLTFVAEYCKGFYPMQRVQYVEYFWYSTSGYSLRVYLPAVVKSCLLPQFYKKKYTQVRVNTP